MVSFAVFYPLQSILVPKACPLHSTDMPSLSEFGYSNCTSFVSPAEVNVGNACPSSWEALLQGVSRFYVRSAQESKKRSTSAHQLLKRPDSILPRFSTATRVPRTMCNLSLAELSRSARISGGLLHTSGL